MMKSLGYGLILFAAATATPVFAQSDTDIKTFAVTGNVPPICSGGVLTGTGSTFEVGVLIDTATGFLRTDLAAPNKQLAGSFCSARSTISVNATPMLAQNFTTTPPANFSRTVNYTATASGWTDSPAVFTVGAASNPAAVQQRPTAFSGDIIVGVSSFTTAGGAALRLVADTSYVGTVTVTLAVVN